MLNPQSIMPVYKWLISDDLDMSTTPRKIRVMQMLGVPYPAGYDQTANDALMKQASVISADLKTQGIDCAPNKEIIAVIAYLQRLGVDIHSAGLSAAVQGNSN
jgi:cytochrome c oxidase cbb3-type subunit I/II